jgi:hypothetical protein
MPKLTRRQLAEFLTEHGYKTSIHLLNRLCQPSIGLGPPAVGRWGPSDIYEGAEALTWAEARALAAKERPRYAIAPEHIGGKKPVPKSMPIASSKPRSQRRRIEQQHTQSAT